MSTKYEVTDAELTFLKLKLNWQDTTTRQVLASNGVALNVLINDENVVVRRLVAAHPYKLAILRNDPDEAVRRIAEQTNRRRMYADAKKIVDDMFAQVG